MYKVEIISTTQQNDQSYIYTYPFSLRFFSHKDYYKILGSILCGIVLIGQSFYIPQWELSDYKSKFIDFFFPFFFGAFFLLGYMYFVCLWDNLSHLQP